MHFSWEIMYYIFHNFFLKRKLQLNSRLDRNSWCVYHTRRIRKVVVLIWSLLTSRGLLGNGRRPFQVMVGLTFVCLSCVFIIMRNMKRNKQGGKNQSISLLLCVILGSFSSSHAQPCQYSHTLRLLLFVRDNPSCRANSLIQQQNFSSAIQ